MTDKITILCETKIRLQSIISNLFKVHNKCQANEFSKTTNYRLLACSKRSDSGKRCEVKKAMKVEGDWGERCSSSLAFIFSRTFLLLRSPLSERLEKANRPQVCPSVPPIVFTVLFILFLSCFNRLFLVFRSIW